MHIRVVGGSLHLGVCTGRTGFGPDPGPGPETPLGLILDPGIDRAGSKHDGSGWVAKKNFLKKKIVWANERWKMDGRDERWKMDVWTMESARRELEEFGDGDGIGGFG